MSMPPLLENVAVPPAYAYPGDYKGHYVVCPGAAVSPCVTFDEGCVVLARARIVVDAPLPHALTLHFGAYCLIEEHALIHIRISSPSTVEESAEASSSPVMEVRVGPFTHVQSRASLRLELRVCTEPGNGAACRVVQLDRGVTFSPFASLSVVMDWCPDVSHAADAVTTLIGPHTHLMPYAALHCHFTAREGGARAPVVGGRQVVLRVPLSASPSVVVPRGGTRSVAEVGAIVDHLDSAPSQPSGRRHEADDTLLVLKTPIRVPSDAAAGSPMDSDVETSAASQYNPWHAMARSQQDRDEEIENDAKKRCRYYLAL